MNREARRILGGFGVAKGISQLATGCQALPRVFRLEPPLSSMQAFVCGVNHFVDVVHSKLFTFGNASLVEPSQVCNLDFQPSQATGPERLGLAEEKKSSTVVGSHLVEIGRERVSTTTEVHVVREIESLIPVSTSDFELEVLEATHGVKSRSPVFDFTHGSVPLLLSPVSLFRGRLRRMLKFGVQRSNLGNRLARVPCFEHNIEDIPVDSPSSISEDI